MTDYTMRVTRLTVAPDGEPLFSDHATHVEIDDEGGGEFVVITQCGENERPGRIAIDKSGWAHIRYAVNELMGVVSD